MDVSKFLDRFRDAVADHRVALEAALLALAKRPDDEQAYSEAARRLHTLKGEARMMGYEGVAQLAHAAEDRLKASDRSEIETDLLLEALDASVRLLEQGPESRDEALLQRLRGSSGERKGAESSGKEPEGGGWSHAAPTDEPPLGDSDRFLRKFRDSSAERLQNLNRAILEVAEQPDDEPAVRDLLREVHTLKGEARMMGLREVAALVHHLEDFLKERRDHGELRTLSGSHDVVFDALDALAELIEARCDRRESAVDLESVIQALGTDRRAPKPVSAPSAGKAAASAPTAPTPSPAVRRSGSETIRVAVDKLERIAGVTGDLLVRHSAAEVRLTDLRQILDKLKDLERTLRQDPGSMRRRSALDTCRRVRQRMQRVLKREKEGLLDTTLTLTELRGRIQDVRMLPIATVFDFYPRIVRDMARQLNRSVRLELHGRETELDRRILEAIRDPLVHLIRNALDHGIEPRDERTANGKPEEGVLRLSAAHHGDRILIQIEDDGAGMDPAAIRDAAVKAGVITGEEAKHLDPESCLELVCRPGFSTAEEVTEMSGRGVGMDVVARNIQQLGGSLSVRSRLGSGTTISMSVPLTLALARVLLVRSAGQVYALPSLEITDIVRTQILEAADGHREVDWGEGVIPATDLAGVLGLSGVETWGAPPAIVLSDGTHSAAFIVDALVGEREVVVKGLGEFLNGPPCLSGAAVLGDGSIAIVLSPHEVVSEFRQCFMDETSTDETSGEQEPRPAGSHVASHHESPGPPSLGASVLVVDDSIVVRDMMRRILERAGCAVEVAVDGQDALERLETGAYDLVVSDVQMPKLDGLGLSRAIRADERYTDLPILMVTTLSGEEDRKAGREAGADAYIVKSELRPADLLDTIRGLLHPNAPARPPQPGA